MGPAASCSRRSASASAGPTPARPCSATTNGRTHEHRTHRRAGARHPRGRRRGDRKSTRLNSSHVEISYAVFCLKKKKKKNMQIEQKPVEVIYTMLINGNSRVDHRSINYQTTSVAW